MLMDIMIGLVVVSLTLCSVVYLHLVHITSVVEALSFTVVLVVASIPLAIEIVTTTTLALGSKELSHHGAIVTRLSAIEDLAGMAILCSDKTGTLTLNKMVIQEDAPVYFQGETRYTLLQQAALASKWKEPPKDALDTLTLTAADLHSLDRYEQLDHLPFDPSVKRTESTLRDRTTGQTFKTTKGAPQVILKLINNPYLAQAVEADVKSFGERGIRTLAVARTHETTGEWLMMGMLTFLDPPRPDTIHTIDEAHRYGVAVKMITGDHQLIARETAKRLNLGYNILASDGLPSLDPVTRKKPVNLAQKYGDLILHADGFAEVFPEHKYLIVECLRELGYKVGMTGDGVNDAPALKRAGKGLYVFTYTYTCVNLRYTILLYMHMLVYRCGSSCIRLDRCSKGGRRHRPDRTWSSHNSTWHINHTMYICTYEKFYYLSYSSDLAVVILLFHRYIRLPAGGL